MSLMRALARWSVVVAFCIAVVFAAAQPALDSAGKPAADAVTAGGSSGLQSRAAPEDRWFVAAGAAVAGVTVLKAAMSIPLSGIKLIPNGERLASSHALDASHPSPHLRSIPLLI